MESGLNVLLVTLPSAQQRESEWQENVAKGTASPTLTLQVLKRECFVFTLLASLSQDAGKAQHGVSRLTSAQTL